MKVRLLTDLSMATGEYRAGSVVDVETDELITAGLAVAEEDAPPHVESAMLSGAPETATMPRARARG